LADDGYPVVAEEVDDAVRRHPAFGITEGDLPGIWIGQRIIRLPTADRRQ
jgi:hypothetical protein